MNPKPFQEFLEKLFESPDEHFPVWRDTLLKDLPNTSTEYLLEVLQAFKHLLSTFKLKDITQHLRVLIDLLTDIQDVAEKGSLIASEKSIGLVPLLVEHVITDERVEFLTRLQAMRCVNTVLEDINAEGLAELQSENTLSFLCDLIGAALYDAGDFDFQLSMVEFLFRMTANDDVKRQTIATTCFQDKNIRKIFTAVSDTEFEADARTFLNALNESMGDERSVYSYPCKRILLGSRFQPPPPKDEKLKGYWMDCNLGSRTITVFVNDRDAEGERSWELISVQANEVVSYHFKDIESPGCIQKKQVLYIKMKNPVNKLLTFCPKSEQSRLVKIEFVSPSDIHGIISRIFGPRRGRSVSSTSSDGQPTSQPKTSVSVNAVLVTGRANGESQVIPTPSQVIPSVLLAEDNNEDIQADVSDISRKAGNYTEKTDEERNCVVSVEEEHVSGVVDNAAGEVMEEKEILLVPQQGTIERIASTAGSEPTQISGKSPAVEVCGRKTACVVKTVKELDMETEPPRPCHETVKDEKLPLLQHDCHSQDENIQQEMMKKEKPRTSSSDYDAASVCTETYSPVSGPRSAVVNNTARRPTWNVGDETGHPIPPGWSTDEADRTGLQGKKRAAKKGKRKRTKPALPVTRVTTPSREKKMSDTCSPAEERKITGEAGTTKPNSRQLPSDQTPSTPKPYNKSVKRKVFSSSQGKSFQSSPKCKDAVNISVSLPKQPPLTTSTPYQPALRPCAKEKEPEEQCGQEDNVQVIQDSQPLSDTQEEMECPSEKEPEPQVIVNEEESSNYKNTSTSTSEMEEQGTGRKTKARKSKIPQRSKWRRTGKAKKKSNSKSRKFIVSPALSAILEENQGTKGPGTTTTNLKHKERGPPSEERDPGEGPSSGPVVKKDASVNSTRRTRSQQPLSEHGKARKQEKSQVSAGKSPSRAPKQNIPLPSEEKTRVTSGFGDKKEGQLEETMNERSENRNERSSSKSNRKQQDTVFGSQEIENNENSPSIGTPNIKDKEMSHPSEERDPGEGPSSGPVVKKDTSVNSTCRTRSQQPLSDHRKGRKQEKSRVSVADTAETREVFKKIGEEAGKQTNAGVEHNSSGGEGTGVISCNEAREFVETLHQHSAAKSRKQQILVGAAERCQNAKDETTGSKRAKRPTENVETEPSKKWRGFPEEAKEYSRNTGYPPSAIKYDRERSRLHDIVEEITNQSIGKTLFRGTPRRTQEKEYPLFDEGHDGPAPQSTRASHKRKASSKSNSVPSKKTREYVEQESEEGERDDSEDSENDYQLGGTSNQRKNKASSKEKSEPRRRTLDYVEQKSDNSEEDNSDNTEGDEPLGETLNPRKRATTSDSKSVPNREPRGRSERERDNNENDDNNRDDNEMGDVDSENDDPFDNTSMAGRTMNERFSPLEKERKTRVSVNLLDDSGLGVTPSSAIATRNSKRKQKNRSVVMHRSLVMVQDTPKGRTRRLGQLQVTVSKTPVRSETGTQGANESDDAGFETDDEEEIENENEGSRSKKGQRFVDWSKSGPSKQFTRKDRGVQSSEVQEDNPSSNDEDVSQGLKPKQLFKSAGWCAASLPASSSPKRNTLVGSDHVAPTFRVPTNKIKVEGLSAIGMTEDFFEFDGQESREEAEIRNKCCKLMDEYVVASVANLEALKKGFSEMKQAVDKVMVKCQRQYMLQKVMQERRIQSLKEMRKSFVGEMAYLERTRQRSSLRLERNHEAEQ